ncbi:lipopolysaccharide-induced tumor necrosis factor-alpha factor [Dendroctonus ponderosae]
MSKDVPPPYMSGPPPGFNPGAPAGHYAPGQYPPPPTTSDQINEHQTVIVTHTALVLGPEPTRTVCPHCHANIVSTMEVEANTKTHLFALILCLFGCWPCCCIPYCMDSCQSKKHFCPNCRAYLGVFSD